MKSRRRARPERSAQPTSPVEPPLCLGIEGGGTRTTALLIRGDEAESPVLEFGPSNLKLLSDRELIWRLREVASRLPVAPTALAAVCVGLAGTRSESDRDRVRRAASRVFPKVPCRATDDLETALAAAPVASGVAARVLVLSGTGSCCFGVSRAGATAKVGGRGHVIGDRGSACDIGRRALRELTAHSDRSGRWPLLGSLILDALCLSVPDDLIDWSMQAGKTEVAALAVTVFRAAEKRDPLARRLLEEAAEALAADALACAKRLATSRQRVQFVFNGGVLLKNPRFARAVAKRLTAVYPQAVVVPLERPSVWGAALLAREVAETSPAAGAPASRASKAPAPAPRAYPVLASLPVFDLATLKDSPTERRNPRSLTLDTMPLPDAVTLMLEEEGQVPHSLAKEKQAIAAVVKAIIQAFQSGGNLYYAGAGTSGRLGVLDASECPPTFRAPREQVQGLMAGGHKALWSAVEGAEDDAEAGAAAVAHRRVGPKDVVIGLAASGRTPYVWGALAEAKRRGAVTALVCFNPAIKTAVRQAVRARPQTFQPDHLLAPDLGPEVLTGSTRLKAGTATKQLLNIFTTLAMSRAGKVISNLMIDLNPSNLKLRDRAERIVSELTGASRDDARAALEASGWVVKNAYLALKANRRQPKAKRSS